MTIADEQSRSQLAVDDGMTTNHRLQASSHSEILFAAPSQRLCRSQPAGDGVWATKRRLQASSHSEILFAAPSQRLCRSQPAGDGVWATKRRLQASSHSEILFAAPSRRLCRSQPAGDGVWATSHRLQASSCKFFYRFGPMKSEQCVARWEGFVGACHASEKPVVHKRLIASRASSHKVQD